MAPKPPTTLLRGTLELLLLQALANGPLHGYAMARRIEADTADALSVEEGSMYPALYRLEARGLVTASWMRPAANGANGANGADGKGTAARGSGRRLRVYALTAAGRRRLSAHKREWAAFADAVARMIGARS